MCVSFFNVAAFKSNLEGVLFMLQNAGPCGVILGFLLTLFGLMRAIYTSACFKRQLSWAAITAERRCDSQDSRHSVQLAPRATLPNMQSQCSQFLTNLLRLRRPHHLPACQWGLSIHGPKSSLCNQTPWLSMVEGMAKGEAFGKGAEMTNEKRNRFYGIYT